MSQQELRVTKYVILKQLRMVRTHTQVPEFRLDKPAFVPMRAGQTATRMHASNRKSVEKAPKCPNSTTLSWMDRRHMPPVRL
eukprot:986504-Amphidinium_carterae.1